MGRVLSPLALSALLLAAPAWADKAVMPAFLPELAPFVGTWKVPERKLDGKKVPALYLVIKEEDGKLRIRYQLPVRHKVYTSDWDGRIRLDLQVNMTEVHEPVYSVQAAPAVIRMKETIRYTYTEADRSVREGTYSLAGDGKLEFRCTAFSRNKKDLPCHAPMVYQRVSQETKWPD